MPLIAVTIELPSDLTLLVHKHQDRIAGILTAALCSIEAGEFDVSGSTQSFEGEDEVLMFLAGLPSPERVLLLQPSENLTQRVEHLLTKNREIGLTQEERVEWERYEYLEHLVRIAKSNARRGAGISRH